MKISKVSVFCASSQKVPGKYLQAASRLGEILSENKITANYGGGRHGLMGSLADAMINKGGDIIGVIPRFMLDEGWGNPEVRNMHVVESMHNRKKLLAENVDAIITLPGGVGTLEELLEMITLKQLGQILAPIIIINTDNFFGPLLEMFDKMVEQRFMREVHRKIWSVVSTPDEVLEAIRTAPAWDGSAIKIAPV